MQKIKALIADDNMLELEYFRYLLEEEKDIEIVREVCSGLKAVESCWELEPDVVLLDIRMPDIDGLEVARRLKRMANPPFIVFVTGYPDYAVDGYRLGVIDFLVKPITQEHISLMVAHLKVNMRQRQRLKPEEHLLLNLGGNMTAVNPAEIICFYCNGHKLYYCNQSGEEYQINTPLKEMMGDLERTGFLQANRSYWVNSKRIARMEPSGDRTYMLVMNDRSGTRITLSRRCAQRLGYMEGLKKRIKGGMKGK